MPQRSMAEPSHRRARTLATFTVRVVIGAAAVGTVMAAQHPARHQPPRSATASTYTASVSASTPSSGTAPRTPYSVLQMNLCLSGFAECFDDTRYPKVVAEAIDVIAARTPRAVTVNEACSSDLARVAAETGYHLRFAPVLAHGQRLPCADPAGRGVYGNAVLTQQPIRSSAGRAFSAQVGGEERRRWLCVETAGQVNVCTAHLSTRGTKAARAAHRSQCTEWAAVVAARDDHGPVIAAGDINRQAGCAPAGVWTLTDAEASRLPGRQHSYGSAKELRRPSIQMLPATYTDHDFLLTKTRLLPPPLRPGLPPAPAPCSSQFWSGPVPLLAPLAAHCLSLFDHP
jgi:endonuclease/exonuclease/phosphatase family metal-dependent hydrolase